MYRNNLTKKEIEKRFAERSAADDKLLRSLQNCDRRHFLRTSMYFAGMAAAGGLMHSHGFQVVNVANAMSHGAHEHPDIAFRFAYISDTHLFDRGMNHRFVNSVLRAVEDVNALDPQPDFVFFGGDLAQLGKPGELTLGQQLLSEVRAPIRMIVGEHDWYLDMGDKWRELFGKDYYSFDHKGVHFVALNSVVEKDFWTEKGYTPEERMAIVAGLDDNRQSPFEVGEEQRAWLKEDLAEVDRKTPIIVFSHSPLYKLYKPWNFWTDDAEQVQAILKRFKNVTVIHGHTHQLLTNRIGNMHFHGLLSTAWPWPYAPQGLPEYTVQMFRPDPFNPLDGCGHGSVDVLHAGHVDKHYNLWSRNPRMVTAQALKKNRLEGPRGYDGPSY